MKAIYAAMASIISIYLTAPILMGLAYHERGYHAVGGEWLLIVLIAVATFNIVYKMQKEVENDH